MDDLHDYAVHLELHAIGSCEILSIMEIIFNTLLTYIVNQLAKLKYHFLVSLLPSTVKKRRQCAADVTNVDYLPATAALLRQDPQEKLGLGRQPLTCRVSSSCQPLQRQGVHDHRKPPCSKRMQCRVY